MTFCVHVYQVVGAEICPHCGRDTHETNWQEQARLHREWKAANPDAKYQGWWSI